MDVEFFSGSDLSDKIRSVMGGKNPRMAVAFIGKSLASNLFSGQLPKDLRIICDTLMGGTNPDELEALYGLGLSGLKHLSPVELHTKVFLSDLGAVVGSANASSRAFLEPERRIEAGIFCPPNSPAFEQAATHFEELYCKAKEISQTAIDEARLSFNYPQKSGDTISETVSKRPSFLLFDILATRPDIFGDVHFVFSSEENDKDVVSAAYEDFAVNENPVVQSKSKFRFFDDWRLAEKDWPIDFISIHRGPSGGLYPQLCRSLHYDEAYDVLIAQKIKWNGIFLLPNIDKGSVRAAIDELPDAVWGNIWTAQQLQGHLISD